MTVVPIVPFIACALAAVLFFTGAVWALARKGRLDFGDGLVLVGLFFFWQCLHVFEERSVAPGPIYGERTR